MIYECRQVCILITILITVQWSDGTVIGSCIDRLRLVGARDEEVFFI